MRARTFVGLMSCIAFVLCLYVTPSANAASDEEEIFKVSKTFVKALETSDSKLLNSLYWRSPKISTLGPDASDALLSQGWEEAESESNTAEPLETSVVTLHHPQITMLGDDTAFMTVYHQWTTTNKKTQQTTYLCVRQTEILKKINGKWLLVHTHASYLPVK